MKTHHTSMLTTMHTSPAPASLLTAQIRPESAPLNRVLAYQNDAVVDRIRRDFELTEEDAHQLFNDMVKFLFLCGATYEKGLAPSPKIDDAWHTFIIFTQDYADFCQDHFGRFIHHRPHRLGEIHDPTNVDRCLPLARAIFGEGIGENWLIKVKNDLCSQQCCNGCETSS